MRITYKNTDLDKLLVAKELDDLSRDNIITYFENHKNGIEINISDQRLNCFLVLRDRGYRLGIRIMSFKSQNDLDEFISNNEYHLSNFDVLFSSNYSNNAIK